jgi:mandelamide amidase
MSRGDLTAERYAAALLARCAAVRSLNAFISLEPARVLEAALAGSPHGVAAASYAAARDRHLPALRRLFSEYFVTAQVSAIVFPATRILAPRIGADPSVTIGGRTVQFEAAIARNIAPGSTAGLPGLVLPVGLAPSGLPVALEFDAPAGCDRALLALGERLERVFGRLPPPRL